MQASKKLFGTLWDGREVFLFTLEAGELSLSVSEFGAAWTSLAAPSKKTGRGDILLGFPTLEGYLYTANPYFGATVGRFANRIGGAEFTLDGKTYGLYKNDGGNTLHGGRAGFSRKLWKGESYTDRGGVFVRFELFSPGGDEGYPGNLHAAVSYGLDGAGNISALYEARVDQNCPVNLTNHAYFNLSGEGAGTILSHELTLSASRYVEPGPGLIPTGRLLSVEGTPFDFRKPKAVSAGYSAVCGGDTEAVGTGYDHCFVLDGRAGEMKPCAEAFDPASRRRLKLAATQPGVQFYSGNFLAGVPGKPGSVYGKNAGFCLETQYFPDSPNHGEFPSAVFGPGKDYREQALFTLAWE